VVVDELLLNSRVHTVERVEGTLKVTFEFVASGSNLGHDFDTLFVGDTGSEGNVLQVSADSDTGRLDHGSLFLRERRALKLAGVHVDDVGVGGAMGVIFLDDSIEEIAEGGVRILRTSVAADARVNVLAAREDASLE